MLPNVRSRIAVLTDAEVDQENSVATMLRAVRRHAPPDLDPHVYRVFQSPIESRARLFVPPLARLSRQLTDDQVAAIHLTSPGPAGLLARHLARRLRLPLVGSVHALDAWAALDARPFRHEVLREAYLRWLYAACDIVLASSEGMRRRLIGRGWRADRMDVWMRGVDDTAFSPARRSMDLRRRWQVADDRPAILYAGPLARDRGLMLLFGLVDLLDTHRIPHRLVLAGDGAMSRCLRLRLPNAVLTGRIDHAAMGTVMASADIFISPRERCTAGSAMLEAQACGLPVLVTDSEGARDQMIEGVTGHVCAAGSERDFCWRIAHLVADVERRRAMGRAARLFAVERAWPHTLGPLFASYRAVAQLAASRSESPRRLSRRAPATVA